MEETSIKEFVSRVTSVAERRMRAFILCERLLQLPDDDIRELLETAAQDAALNKRHGKDLLMSLVDIMEALFQIESEGKLILVLQKLRMQNKTLALLIRPPQPHKFLKRGETPVSDLEMDYAPLGVKRSMAKKMDRILIRRMVFEKDPMVIKNLLTNPLLIEKDVLKIASQRPTTREALRVIYAGDKWVQCYKVKEAIIRNPYSPFRLALVLLFYMQKNDLNSIRNDVTLHPDLRAEAEVILRARF